MGTLHCLKGADGTEEQMQREMGSNEGKLKSTDGAGGGEVSEPEEGKRPALISHRK